MKRKVFIGLFILASLVGCSAQPQTTPTAEPTINLDSGNGANSSNSSTSTGATAQGVITPLQEAKLGYLASGSVEKVMVKLGDPVKAGEVLAVIHGKEQAQADLSAALESVQAAQNELDQINRNAGEVTARAQTDLIDKEKDLNDKKDNVSYLKHLRWLKDRNINPDKQNLNKQGYDYPTPEDIAKSEAKLALAQAIYDEAAQHLADVKNGPDPAVLKLAQAKLKTAQDNASAAQATLDNMDIKAPFDGVISTVTISTGDMVTPGQVLFVVTDSSKLEVKTTDLSERDIPLVKVGQQVKVYIKPVGTDVTGVVESISPKADSVGGDVVYEVQISLKEVPEGIRVGMSVEVSFKE
jgi:HlyD family secretion protein